MLFVVLLLLPEVRLRGGSTVAARMPRMPSPSAHARGRRRCSSSAAWAFAGVASEATLTDVAPGLALGLIALSLVPLTGWAGQVSLCQMTFAGMGAFAMAKVAADGSPLGLLAAVADRGAGGRAGRAPRPPAPRPLPRARPRWRSRC